MNFIDLLVSDDEISCLLQITKSYSKTAVFKLDKVLLNDLDHSANRCLAVNRRDRLPVRLVWCGAFGRPDRKCRTIPYRSTPDMS